MQNWSDIDTDCPRVWIVRVIFRKRRKTVIRGQGYDDVLLISNAEERIEECAQRSIETKYLIVELS